MELRFHEAKTLSISVYSLRENLTGKNIYAALRIQTKMYWLIDRNLQLSLENKLLLYKTILKPIYIRYPTLGHSRKLQS